MTDINNTLSVRRFNFKLIRSCLENTKGLEEFDIFIMTLKSAISEMPNRFEMEEQIGFEYLAKLIKRILS